MNSFSGKQTPELDTPRLIIQMAYSLFMELGYKAVSTRKIAQTCSITQPACYFMFNYQIDLMQMFYGLQHKVPEEIQKSIKEKWEKGFLSPIIIILEHAIETGEITLFAKLHINIIKSAIQPE